MCTRVCTCNNNNHIRVYECGNEETQEEFEERVMSTGCSCVKLPETSTKIKVKTNIGFTKKSLYCGTEVGPI